MLEVGPSEEIGAPDCPPILRSICNAKVGPPYGVEANIILQEYPMGDDTEVQP